MAQITDENMYLDNSIHYIDHLKPQCEKCFGLCCVALYFSVQDGFPTDKSAGTPCPNLEADFRCMIHEKLGALGLKGCVAYECFGAGQQVSQVTFAGQNWRLKSASADLMFAVFLIMQQLHEMCWYLTEALSFKLASPICEEIRKALYETERITQLPPHSLREFNLSAHRTKIKVLLRNVSKLVRSEISRINKVTFNADKERKATADFFGRDLRKRDLRCADLRGACLIAANLEGVDLSGTDFIGADFRDANVRGANLSKSIFLTQSQINVAKGNSNTKLPLTLFHPKHWDAKDNTNE
ncbi:pentapeptide repeat-containing protein [Desulforamulus aeronauticus]|uniref:Pentapeptide repeat-containing protein n=1 Tax=Desulforamulus aeronauticus DSM 10349 TaxID=1121421 RepID=A0A1M6NCJ8_9FIRM|nr:pentapeptide repeat-containing protein [Desulforamulus aeronauticus]SHJ93442.1 Pentapeptide repeat-containing protein [Desulforamulus aeronauticus DSM 10349]